MESYIKMPIHQMKEQMQFIEDLECSKIKY